MLLNIKQRINTDIKLIVFLNRIAQNTFEFKKNGGIIVYRYLFNL